MSYDRPEIVIDLTPKGEALGFTTESIAQHLRQRLVGIEAIRLPSGSDEIVARVALPKETVGPSYLHQATVPLAGGGFVALGEIARFREVQGFSSIRRENGDRRVAVTGDLSGEAASGAEVMAALKAEILPDVADRFGVDWHLGGLAEQENEFIGESMIGLGLALVGIYLVLAWVFASWSRPAIVMLVIPFGLVGVVLGHWLHGVPLSMFSVVGLIGMAGIIINDSIVLVTTIDERAPKTDFRTAIVEARSETVDGYANIMPDYGSLSDDEVADLIAYLQDLGER